ncbi:hypothetical protein BRT02_15380 [Listeria monocytogenes]|nr:hypothetical protein [Listeria monocytogenes]
MPNGHCADIIETLGTAKPSTLVIAVSPYALAVIGEVARFGAMGFVKKHAVLVKTHRSLFQRFLSNCI